MTRSPRKRDSPARHVRTAYLSSRWRRRYFTRPKREILPLLYRSHTRVRSAMISRRFFFQRDPASPASSLPPPLVRVGRKRRRWRLITTQSPLPVRPTPTRSEKGSNRLLPPRAIHYRCVYRSIAKPTIFILDSAEKKAPLSLSLFLHHPPSSPPLFSKSPEGRPIALHYWHPGNPLRENGADSTLRTDRRTHRANLRIINGPGSFEHDIGRNADRPRPDYHPRYNSSIEFPISGGKI